MKWKKFSEDVPKDKNPVLIYVEENYYIAMYNKDETLRINNKGKNFFERNENVYWSNLKVPSEVKKEQDKFKKYKL